MQEGHLKQGPFQKGKYSNLCSNQHFSGGIWISFFFWGGSCFEQNDSFRSACFFLGCCKDAIFSHVEWYQWLPASTRLDRLDLFWVPLAAIRVAVKKQYVGGIQGWIQYYISPRKVT